MSSNLFQRVAQRVLFGRSVSERRASSYVAGSLSNPPNWMERFLLGGTAGKDTAGMDVTEQTALSISTVFACVRNVSEDIAKLPFLVYRRTGGSGKERLPEHPVAKLLKNSPNEEMSAFDLRCTVTHHAMLWGNGYVEIERDGNGRPVTLGICEPIDVTVRRSSIDGSIIYVYRDPKTNETRTIFADDMIHIKGLGTNGLVGYSVIAWARKSLGLTAAAEEFGASFFGNSSMPKGVLEHPGVLGETGHDNLRKSWENVHRGASNYGKVAILEEGMKFNPITIPPDDAQFLETRQFQVPEVCRWFRMPPHKVADLSRATFSNIEHSSIEYVGDTLLPWMTRWEQEVERKCFMRSERSLYAEHLTAALLRGDLKSRYESYAIGRQWGWLSPDDVREYENLNPIEADSGGDVYLVPANMMSAERLDDPPEPAAVPAIPATPGELPELPESERSAVDRCFRPLVTELVGRVRRVEADKITRNGKREEHLGWSGKFLADRKTDVVSAFLPLTTSLFASVKTPAGTDLEKEARLLATDLAAHHAAEIKAIVFVVNWAHYAEERSIVWTSSAHKEVESILSTMAATVAKRIAENWS